MSAAAARDLVVPEPGALIGQGMLRKDVTAHYDWSGVVDVAGFSYRAVAELRQDGQGQFLMLRLRILRDVPIGMPAESKGA